MWPQVSRQPQQSASFRVRRTKKLGAEDDAPPLGEQLRGGLAAVGANGAARILLGLQTATWVVVGSLDILFVVLAIRVLHDGPGWVGYLNTAYGAGGLVGGVIAAALIGARRLALPILGSGALLGAALAAVAISSSTAAAALLLALVGGARLFLDVATRTLLQRIVPADVLGRVFGLVEGFSMVGLALGSVLAPLLVWAAGPKGAFVGLALVLPTRRDRRRPTDPAARSDRPCPGRRDRSAPVDPDLPVASGAVARDRSGGARADGGSCRA